MSAGLFSAREHALIFRESCNAKFLINIILQNKTQ